MSRAYIGEKFCTVEAGRTTLTLSGTAEDSTHTHRTHAAALTASDLTDGGEYTWSVIKSDGNYSTIRGTLNDNNPDANTITNITWEDEVGTVAPTDSVIVLYIGEPGERVMSDTAGVTGADAITNIVSLTQAEYEAIGTPDATTIYLMTDTGAFAVGSTVTHPMEFISIALGDETTDLATGTAVVKFRTPYAFTVESVRAMLNAAPSGSTAIFDINEGGTSILSTKLSVDASETTSETAATPAVISDSALADDAEISIDIDQVGSVTAGAGAKITLIGRRTG